MLIMLLLFAALLFVAAVYLVRIYNGLIALRENVRKAWANIDVLLTQRHDELPKLVETCKRYMQYEQETLERVMQARSAVFKAQSRGTSPRWARLQHDAVPGNECLRVHHPWLRATERTVRPGHRFGARHLDFGTRRRRPVGRIIERGLDHLGGCIRHGFLLDGGGWAARRLPQGAPRHQRAGQPRTGQGPAPANHRTGTCPVQYSCRHPA